MLKILLSGYQGRMGQAIRAIVDEDDNFQIIAEIGRGDAPEQHLGQCDVIIDFSVHEATGPLVTAAAKLAKPIVIGTTGLSEETIQRVDEASKTIPIVWAGNYSVGVNLLLHLAKLSANILSDAFEAEVVEMHHHNKVDAPSGTAENILDVLCEAKNIDKSELVYGRSGITGARPRNQIGVHSLRGGSVVGEHTVIFAGDDERIELVHKAGDRKIFANGALRAAQWLRQQPAGLYNMQDVLGFEK